MAHSGVFRSRLLRRTASVVASLLVVASPSSGIAATAAAAAPAPAATPTKLFLQVQSARTVAALPAVQKGDKVDTYQWLIAAENTPDHPELGVGNAKDSVNNCLPSRASMPGAVVVNTNPDWADTCQWPSIRYTPGNVAVVAQGDASQLNGTTALPDLPPGRYLISVTANGYKIDGAHFTVPASGGDVTATVTMQPYPLPLSTIRIRVFNDAAPVDGTYEFGAETGLQGFKATLRDVLAQVSTDYYGNPLCTKYVHDVRGQTVFVDGKPEVDVDADNNGVCVSDVAGDIVIPNLGPNRYATSVTAPAGWYQTTTLEGGHDWDVWQQEGSTGYDTERTIGGEPVPYVDFGFVRAKTLPASAATAHITGTVEQLLSYVGGRGGLDNPAMGWAGAKDGGPISGGLVALSDLQHNDQVVHVAKTKRDGTFDIANVPDGDYQLTAWDLDQDFILWSWNVSVVGGKSVNVGKRFLTGWFTEIRGTIFRDTNGNGRQDAGELGVPQFTVALKERDNSLMDQGTNSVTTDDRGRYVLRESYPLSRFVVLEAFNTRYKTTGVTIQANNEPKPRTLLGAGVDINVLPVIGLGGRVDWGVDTYDAGTNGGIVGTVTYDTTRNELDPAVSVTESYQPGVPGIKVHLNAPVRCGSTERRPSNTCSKEGYRVNYNAADPADSPNGSLVKGPELQEEYTSETWETSRNSVARMFDGKPFSDTDQLFLPDGNATGNGKACLEAPLAGWLARPSDTTPGAFGQTVNGNYAFSNSKLNQFATTDPRDPKDPSTGQPLAQWAVLADYNLAEQQLLPLDYLVSVEIPKDAYGKPLYKVTNEESVNVFSGDGFLPQENFPPTAALASDPPAAPAPQPEPELPTSQAAGFLSRCVGEGHVVATNPVTNSAFAAAGGSPFEGQWRQSCDAKLVTIRDGQAVAPNFNIFTEVPLPTHFWGIVLNDLGLSHDARQSAYGEAQPLPGVPTGIYDWSGRLVDTVLSDFNGQYEALEPSTSTYNCPLPAGPCPNMYRFVGNDPGQPGALNPDYNPRFRTIATNFQAWPGLYTVTDTAPTQVAVTALAPDATQATPVDCSLDGATPQLYAVSQPYVRQPSAPLTGTEITVSGIGFGTSGTLRLGTTTMATTAWSDRSIKFTVPSDFDTGAQQLSITNAAGQQGVNGLTLQILGVGYNPVVRDVGPGRRYATVQAALQDAARPANQRALVVVWPGTPAQDNPRGTYYENIVMHSKVKLQGVGPGGIYPDGTYVPGSILDGTGFSPDNAAGQEWAALVNSTRHIGPALVPDAAVVTFLGNRATAGNDPYRSAINGFTITGGSQSDFATNLRPLFGNTKTPIGAPGATITQGGGIYEHAGGRGLRISDNIIVGNSGSYGGAVRIGTPYLTGNGNNLANSAVVISYNRIRDNGGTNLAGAVAIFEGSTGYSVDHNDLCGNFSAEYGGAISQYGMSSGGRIASNRIYFNQSYDEGGGVFVGGELVIGATALSTGTGDVTIDANLIQDNVANDDGGGVRLLMAERGKIAMTNNMIVNNISAHEGGGLALDDSPYVDFVNNTVMKNITTATAMTSDGKPAPAGLSTTGNSDALQAYLLTNDRPMYDKGFSDPVIRNSVFVDNRAGSWNAGGYVTGIGSPQEPTPRSPLSRWDMGAVDTRIKLAPTYSLYEQNIATYPLDPSSTNTVGPFTDPVVTTPFDTNVVIETSRTTPAFRQSVIVAVNVPPRLMGNYHLAGTSSPAWGAGTDTPAPPPIDFDGQPRPTGTNARIDAGADQQQ